LAQYRERDSLDVARRHLNKGQIAIVVAKMHPDADEVGDRGQKGLVSKHFPMVTKFALSQARTIVRYAPELADRVLGLKGKSFSDGFLSRQACASISCAAFRATILPASLH
jgi:hypothetical protein